MEMPMATPRPGIVRTRRRGGRCGGAAPRRTTGPSPAGSPRPSREEVDDRHEESGADDGPQDREWVPADGDHEGLREADLPGQPGAEKGADEAEDGGDDQAAANAAGDGLADGAADGGDDDEKQEGDERHGWSPSVGVSVSSARAAARRRRRWRRLRPTPGCSPAPCP